eukprot:TRINITY_DN150_c0_g1_i1.p2 TRINITY_DN150_c0_g1~~TRINITY_DN150_c0_g1_i1.p2  ORF type:complete len:145 (+),score=17.29 TRINITY_DN150_c0_g1_i1:927-1361(+)
MTQEPVLNIDAQEYDEAKSVLTPSSSSSEGEDNEDVEIVEVLDGDEPSKDSVTDKQSLNDNPLDSDLEGKTAQNWHTPFHRPPLSIICTVFLCVFFFFRWKFQRGKKCARKNPDSVFQHPLMVYCEPRQAFGCQMTVWQGARVS